MDKILLVQEAAPRRQALATFLTGCGYEVLVIADHRSAKPLLAQMPDIIVTELRLADADGLEMLRQAHQLWPETPVIITAGCGSIASAVAAIKQGAFDYLAEPIKPEALLRVIQQADQHSQLPREARRLRQQGEKHGCFFGLVGQSEPMRRIFEQIQLVAQTNCTDLITGESGTGKELVARAIHQLSARKEGPFVALNCAAIPHDLAESELFGHARGAFTGATDRRIGKFAAAHHGTLLIDEIGEMGLPVQAKLVRALETHTISPVGSNEEQRIEVRVVAATHRNLRSLVEEGKFREDLYYRLNVVNINLPPLRQRREDIPLLVATFLQQISQENGRRVPEVSRAGMDALRSYPWPGNVRELRNLLEGVVVLSRKAVIDLDDLSPSLEGSKIRKMVANCRPGATLAELEREAIQQCLYQTRGNRQRTATLLGISTRTLLRKIQKYRLADPLRRPSAV